MTEVYFLYYEEHDWAAHIQRAGYKLYYQPKSHILHKESLATGRIVHSKPITFPATAFFTHVEILGRYP